MNRKQTIALWVGVACIALMCLVPPWRLGVHNEGVYGQGPLGYSLLFWPPYWHPGLGHSLTLDFSRLFVQWVAVIAVTGAAIYTLRDKRGE